MFFFNKRTHTDEKASQVLVVRNMPTHLAYTLLWAGPLFTAKKGHVTECTDNRTISLISHASKILLRIIQRRLETYI
jgi:hypothetical protein